MEDIFGTHVVVIYVFAVDASFPVADAGSGKPTLVADFRGEPSVDVCLGFKICPQGRWRTQAGSATGGTSLVATTVLMHCKEISSVDQARALILAAVRAAGFAMQGARGVLSGVTGTLGLAQSALYVA